jgi:hypothetical protein
MSGMSDNEHMAAWAMQELSRPGAAFTERVEARKVIGEIVKQADAYEGAVDLIRELLRFVPYEKPEQGPLPTWIVDVAERARTAIGEADA